MCCKDDQVPEDEECLPPVGLRWYQQLAWALGLVPRPVHPPGSRCQVLMIGFPSPPLPFPDVSKELQLTVFLFELNNVQRNDQTSALNKQ